MIKRSEWMLILIILSLVTILSLWLLQGLKVLDSSMTFIETTEMEGFGNDKIVRDDVLSHNILSRKNKEDTEKQKSLSFVLMAVSTDIHNNYKALVKVNKHELQWFYLGDKVIDTYSIHNINNSLVTLFDGKGAYYEISLYEP